MTREEVALLILKGNLTQARIKAEIAMQTVERIKKEVGILSKEPIDIEAEEVTDE